MNKKIAALKKLMDIQDFILRKIEEYEGEINRPLKLKEDKDSHISASRIDEELEDWVALRDDYETSLVFIKTLVAFEEE